VRYNNNDGPDGLLLSDLIRPIHFGLFTFLIPLFEPIRIGHSSSQPEITNIIRTHFLYQAMKRYSFSLLYIVAIISVAFAGTLVRKHVFPKEGNWKAIVQADQQDLPMNLEVRGTQAENARIFLTSGTERLELRNFDQHGDSVLIEVEPYRARITVKVEKERLTGIYTVHLANNQTLNIPFRAIHGDRHEVTHRALAELSHQLDLSQSTALR